MADHLGRQLGNYRLIRLLGRGGFADVYLGEHVHLDINAAIKLLHTQLTDEDIALFRSEARTLARLIHPQIVRLLDFGIENNIPYLVMDYAPNGTFRERYPRHTTLPLPSIIAYVMQVADALQFAHDEKLIHRDIKPENMFLGRRNEVVVGDFGIAVLSKSTRSRNLQDIAGTVEYMSPEQLHGKPGRASDQYSLAIVVYEWLTGEVPFGRGETYRLLKQYNRAIADFDRAIAIDPNYAWAYGSRGQVYSALKQQQKAIQDFDRALAIDPSLNWVKTARDAAVRQS